MLLMHGLIKQAEGDVACDFIQGDDKARVTTRPDGRGATMCLLCARIGAALYRSGRACRDGPESDCGWCGWCVAPVIDDYRLGQHLDVASAVP